MKGRLLCCACAPRVNYEIVMARASFTSGQRLRELVKVMIKKFDERSGEGIMRTQILERFVIKSLPTDVSVIL